MDLSPNDVRGYEFHSQMRGYDKAEVDGLIEQVATALEEARQQNLRLSMELESLKNQLMGLKQFEDTIKSAAIDARRNADLTVADARQEAAAIIAKAKQEAETIVVNRTREISEIEARITRLGSTKKSYLAKIRGMIQAHMDMIDDVDSGEIAPEVERDGDLSITESNDVTAEALETIGQPDSDAESKTEFDTVEGSEDVDNGTSGRVDENLAAKLKDVIQDESSGQSDGDTIDPELAAALESYKRLAAKKVSEAHRAAPAPAPAPAMGEMVETNALAEDIPPGFIAKTNGSDNGPSTDKMIPTEGRSAVSRKSKSKPNSDMTESGKVPFSQDQLAGELDEVAARFEEEINKAAKS